MCAVIWFEYAVSEDLIPEEGGCSRLNRDRQASAAVLVTGSLAVAPPLPDGTPADAATEREVLCDFGGDTLEGHPVDTRGDECLQLHILRDLWGYAGTVRAPVFTGRGGRFRQGLQCLLKGGFKGRFKGLDRSGVRRPQGINLKGGLPGATIRPDRCTKPRRCACANSPLPGRA